jgi:hypothetical protein
MRRTTILAAAALLLPPPLLAGAAGHGAAQAQGANGDALPLRRGFYLPEGTPCARASNAELLLFTGRGFNVSGAECRITRVRRQGEAYDIAETCRDIRSGDRIDGQSRILPGGPEAYTLVSDGSRQRFRLCPQAQLPAPWRNNRIP